MRVISNSEVSLFNACEYKHFIEFGLNLTRKQLTTSLNRGTSVHEFLEIYYKVVKASNSHDAGIAALKTYAAQLFKASEEEYGYTPELLMESYLLVDQYLKCYGDETGLYRILMVEKELQAPTPDPNIAFGMKLDLLVEFISGPYKGHIVLVDHKTCYNFYSQAQLDFNPQVPKYVGTLRQAGYDVNYAMFNQLRYRNTKENKDNTNLKFHRDVIQPSDYLVKRIMREHWETSQRIAHLSTFSPEHREAHTVRVLNHLVCDNCMYSDLCFTRLNGESDKILVASEYKPRVERYHSETEPANV